MPKTEIGLEIHGCEYAGVSFHRQRRDNGASSLERMPADVCQWARISFSVLYKYFTKH